MYFFNFYKIELRKFYAVKIFNNTHSILIKYNLKTYFRKDTHFEGFLNVLPMSKLKFSS